MSRQSNNGKTYIKVSDDYKIIVFDVGSPQYPT